MNAETFDTSSLHSTVTNNHRITIPAGLAGYYCIGYTMNFYQASVGKTENIKMWRGGTVSEQVRAGTVTIYEATNGQFHELVACTIQYLAETDYVWLTGATSDTSNNAGVFMGFSPEGFYAYKVG
jgi:hypothetical protein